MSVAADDQAGKAALEALRQIREHLGVNQTIGASNISYGLPDRRAVNTVFLAMAVMNGLTCPITDPSIWEVRRTLLLTDPVRRQGRIRHELHNRLPAAAPRG